MKPIMTETVGPVAINMATAPLLNGLPGSVDAISQIVSGYANSDDNEKAGKALQSSGKLVSSLPGVAGNHRARRRLQMQRLLTGKTNPHKILSQRFGTNTLLTTGLGALLGGAGVGLTGGSAHDILEGSLYGGIGGLAVAGAGDIIGSLLAAIKQTRSLKQQKQYQESPGSTVANFLVPGFAAYNGWKSIGAMNSDQYDKALDAQYKKGKQQKKASLHSYMDIYRSVYGRA